MKVVSVGRHRAITQLLSGWIWILILGHLKSVTKTYRLQNHVTFNVKLSAIITFNYTSLSAVYWNVAHFILEKL